MAARVKNLVFSCTRERARSFWWRRVLGGELGPASRSPSAWSCAILSATDNAGVKASLMAPVQHTHVYRIYAPRCTMCWRLPTSQICE